MSDFNVKKPDTKDDFIRLLVDIKSRIQLLKQKQKKTSTKPTVSETAKMMGVHRSTLYEWMNEFGVKFKNINECKVMPMDVSKRFEEPVYLIGEALLGEGPEIAHIDLIIGSKNGPVGQAFANSLSHLSAGHTPLLAVIRPNLPPKPYTLLVPKVTVKNTKQIETIFGPAQAGVAKAVADSVEENIIPKEKIEDWLIIVSVFVNPDSKDFRRIYHYNYGATKLAIKRALNKYPSLEKIMFDKDRAKHPIMGFNVPRLWRPPYLQIALDVPNIELIKKIITELPNSDRIILEIGTPLLKKYGVKAISDLREITKDVFVVADLKTLDVGKVEVDLAFEATADAVVASGLASNETLNSFISEAKRLGIYAAVDMMNVKDPIQKLQTLKYFPNIVILHRGIDAENTTQDTRWILINELRQAFKDIKFLIAVAGGITPETAPEALASGADIIIVGRYITQSRDVKRSVREFLESNAETKQDIDLFRVHIE